MSEAGEPEPRSSASGDTSKDDVATVQVERLASAEADLGAPAIGNAIGRYVVLEEVGHGGMGRVLRAYDPKLQREVALKEVWSRAQAEETKRGLVAEARAMAKLSHPNVVGVYDVESVGVAGSERLVLVMEYVAGQTLRAWLRVQPRSWADVVERFIAAGRGLAAAHAAGLLHRDFKPANVLVSVHGTVKVTDFGLAKGTTEGARSGVSTSHSESLEEESTEAGVVMGTPRYMAPEQHLGAPLTEAADQYALCVALWEALCGAPPFSGKGAVGRKLEGPPKWPATEVPRAVADAVRRGLQVDPAHRWPSMEALLDALTHEPRRRHRALALAIVVVAVALGGAGLQSWGRARAARCSGASDKLAGIWDEPRRQNVKTAILGVDAGYAAHVWERTQTELDAYANDWVAMHTQACEATTVRGEQSSEVMDLRMACLHRAAVDLRAVVGVLGDADAEVVRRAHDVTGGLRSLSRCADIEALREDVEPPLSEEVEDVEEARHLLAEAMAQGQAGRYEAARRHVEAAAGLVAQVEYGPVGVEVELAQGEVLASLGKYEASELAYRGALESAARLRLPEAMGHAANKLLSVVGHRQRRMDEGLRYRELAMGLASGDPAREARARNSLANVLADQGKYDDAAEEHRLALESWERALGPEHPSVAMAHNNLANVLAEQGNSADAEDAFREVLRSWQRSLGPEHPHVAMARNNLANVLADQGKLEEAEREYRSSLQSWERALGPAHPDVAMARNNLANVLAEQGEYAHAEDLFRDALASWERALGPAHPDVAMARNNLANVLADQGKLEEAEAGYREALELREHALGPEHPDIAMSRNNLANVLAAQGKHAEAEQGYREALVSWERTLGGEHPHVAMARNNLAAVLLDLGAVREALALAEEAWRHCEGEDFRAERRAETAFLLARALSTVKTDAPSHARARTLAEDALRTYGEAGPAGVERGAEVRAWLDRSGRSGAPSSGDRHHQP